MTRDNLCPPSAAHTLTDADNDTLARLDVVFDEAPVYFGACDRLVTANVLKDSP